MCLSIPARVISVKDDKAMVMIGSAEYEASLQLLEDVNVGDYILLHTGFAISKISEEDAMETMKLLQELAEIDDLIRKEEKQDE